MKPARKTITVGGVTALRYAKLPNGDYMVEAPPTGSLTGGSVTHLHRFTPMQFAALLRKMAKIHGGVATKAKALAARV